MYKILSTYTILIKIEFDTSKYKKMNTQKVIIDDFTELAGDYSSLVDAYDSIKQNCKTNAEHKLIDSTFGLYINDINTHSVVDIDLFHDKLENTYTIYYMTFMANINKCNRDNFNKLRDIVCPLLDKYKTESYMDAKSYYMDIEDYLTK